MLHAALRIVCSDENEGDYDERRAERLPLFFVPFADGTLQPIGVVADEDKLDVITQNLTATTKIQWQILSERAHTVRPHFLAAIYSDFLWRNRKLHNSGRPIEFARNALKHYHNSVNERIGQEGLFWHALSASQQLGRIARELNDVASVACAARLIGELVDALEPRWGDAPGWLLRAARSVHDLAKAYPPFRRPSELSRELEKMHQRLSRFMPSGSPIIATHIGRDVIDCRSDLEQILNLPSNERRELQKAQSFAEESKAREVTGNHLAAATLAAEAVKLLSQAGAQSDAAAARRRTREMYEFAANSAARTEIKAHLPLEPFRAMAREVTASKDLGSALRWASAAAIPSWAATIESAAEAAAENVLSARVPATRIVDGRPVSRSADGRPGILRDHWILAIRIGASMTWRALFEGLKPRLTVQALADELVSAGVIPSHNQLAFRKAIEAGLSGDHISACHMLPGLIESSLRRVFASHGLDVNAYAPGDGGRMQERTMGAFFGQEDNSPLTADAMRVLGEDRWNWFRAVLFDEEILGLRHRAAHGLLRDDECSAENTETLLLGLAALLDLDVAPKSGVATSSAQDSKTGLPG